MSLMCGPKRMKEKNVYTNQKQTHWHRKHIKGEAVGQKLGVWDTATYKIDKQQKTCFGVTCKRKGSEKG